MPIIVVHDFDAIVMDSRAQNGRAGERISVGGAWKKHEKQIFQMGDSCKSVREICEKKESLSPA